MTIYFVLALATFRLTRLLVVDEFPPIADARARVVDRWGIDSWQAYLSQCPWCVSVYTAAVVVGVAVGAGVNVPAPVASWAMCSAATGLIATNLDR